MQILKARATHRGNSKCQEERQGCARGVRGGGALVHGVKDTSGGTKGRGFSERSPGPWSCRVS